MRRAPVQPATPRRGGRRLAVLVVVAVALAGAGFAAVVLKPWRPWRYGTAEPPQPALDRVAPPLARRLDELTTTVREQPYSVAAWARLGAVYDVHDLFAEAVVCYARAERLDPTDFRWPYLTGVCRTVGDQRAALDDFRRALARRDDYAPLHARLGRGLLAVDDLDGAERHCRRAAELDPAMVRPHLDLARVALARDDAGAALAHLERGLALGPSEGEMHALLAETYRRRGEHARAAEHLEQAREGKPLEPLPDPLHAKLGWDEGVTRRWREVRTQRYLRDGRPQLAVAEWEAAVRDDPEASGVVMNLAILYVEVGRLGDAVTALERVVELEPEHPTARRHLGELRVRTGDVGRGITILREVCVESPDDAQAHLQLARALTTAGRLDEAHAVYGRTLALDRTNARALFEHGTLLVRLGRMEDAVGRFRAVTIVQPGQVAAYTNLARSYYRLGRHAEALAAVRAGQRNSPGDTRLSNSLAWILATCPDDGLRRGSEARAIAEGLCQRTGHRDPSLLDTLAAACAETGDFETAVRSVQQAYEIVVAGQTMPAGPARDAMAAGLLARLQQYRRGEPHRDAALE